jgi:hypothetical protein
MAQILTFNGPDPESIGGLIRVYMRTCYYFVYWGVQINRPLRHWEFIGRDYYHKHHINKELGSHTWFGILCIPSTLISLKWMPIDVHLRVLNLCGICIGVLCKHGWWWCYLCEGVTGVKDKGRGYGWEKTQQKLRILTRGVSWWPPSSPSPLPSVYLSCPIMESPCTHVVCNGEPTIRSSGRSGFYLVLAFVGFHPWP